MSTRHVWKNPGEWVRVHTRRPRKDPEPQPSQEPEKTFVEKVIEWFGNFFTGIFELANKTDDALGKLIVVVLGLWVWGMLVWVAIQVVLLWSVVMAIWWVGSLIWGFRVKIGRGLCTAWHWSVRAGRRVVSALYQCMLSAWQLIGRVYKNLAGRMARHGPTPPSAP